MAPTLSKRIYTYSDGDIRLDGYVPPPEGYSLFQLKDDYAIFGSPRDCSFGGCPSVVPLFPDDRPDVLFNKDWQFALVAWNQGMSPAAIMSLMGDTKAFMNGTGISGAEERNNYLTGNIGHPKDPATDKFRSMCLNTHAGYIEGDWMYPLALSGSVSPPMKSGKPRPQTLDEIVPEDYLITPWSHPYFFLECTNVKWKPDTSTLDYGAFDNGIKRSWVPDGNIHTYFPFVTNYVGTRTPKGWWRELADGELIPSAIRRG